MDDAVNTSSYDDDAVNATAYDDDAYATEDATLMDEVAPFLYNGIRIAAALWLIWTAAGASL